VARTYPALEVHWNHPVAADYLDHLLASVDDASPTAIEERDDGQLRIFFATAADRSRGAELIACLDPALRWSAIDVSDEDWAVRSQSGLGPVQVGKIQVVSTSLPPTSGVDRYQAPSDPRGRHLISILPSMGFGTGHHASTRRCLALLQRVPVEGTRVFDAGTGSGVLALAAWKLGAREVLAVDADPDALTAAEENLERNGATDAIQLKLVDLGRLFPADPASAIRGPFDLVLANLTGGALIRYAPTLASLLARGGRVIASGFQTDEVEAVSAAFAPIGLSPVERDDEERWVGLILRSA
jgi:ribosomal protein L11 methyltransferase